MDRPTFVALLEEQFDHIRELNSTKGVEYSGHEDVLSDFRAVAEAAGITQEQALITYATKHWRAINSYVQKGAVLSEPIEGRLQDLILYSLLMIGMIRDKEAEAGRVTTVQEAWSRPYAGLVADAEAVAAAPIEGLPHEKLTAAMGVERAKTWLGYGQAVTQEMEQRELHRLEEEANA